MFKKYKDFIVLLLFLTFSLFLFKEYLLDNKVPFPSNLLASFYEPWTTYKLKDYPNGPPSKPMGFDNLRTFYPVRKLVTNTIREKKPPLWNPYIFSGNVLLGTYQSAVFHPLGFLFFLLPQIDAWSIIILLQPMLGGFFMYLFLKELSLGSRASLFGSAAFAFSGIIIVWWEEMFMAGYTVLLLPLVMLAITRMFKKTTVFNYILFIISLVFSIFSGWFQMTLYTYIFSFLWCICLYIQDRKLHKRTLMYLIIGFIVSVLIASIHLLPSVEAYMYSPRGTSDIMYDFTIYLMPLYYLVTFLAPDFFGNPAVHNHFGTGFYHEKVIFIGIAPLLFGILVIIRQINLNSKERFFKWAWIISLSLGFSLPTTWLLLYYLKLPFFSVMLPSRIFFVSSFCLAVLSAIGMRYYLDNKIGKKQIMFVLGIMGLTLVVSWAFVMYHRQFNPTSAFASITLRNLIIPTLIYLSCTFLIGVGTITSRFKNIIYLFLLMLVFLSSFLYARKYLYFSDRKFVYPDTPVVNKLKEMSGTDRFWSMGKGYINNNFSIYFELYSLEGYEPFYPKRYGELIYSSHTQGKLSGQMPRADATLYKLEKLEEFILNPYREKLIQLLGVKYIIEKRDAYELPDDKKKEVPLKLTWQDDKYNIYIYTKAYPRVFLADNYLILSEDRKIIDAIYNKNTDLSRKVILEKKPVEKIINKYTQGNAEITDYSENEVKIQANADGDSFLFLSDNYYPGWKAYVDDKETNIYRADYSFRSIFVPRGNHSIVFEYHPISFYAGIILTFIGMIILVIISIAIKKRMYL